MGFDVANLLTSEQLVQEFLCPICVMLVEQPVITACRWERALPGSASKRPCCAQRAARLSLIGAVAT